MKLHRTLVVALALAAAGCSIRPMTASEAARSGQNTKTVDAEQISRSTARTAWDALQLLGGYLRLEEDNDRRPTRVSSRGRSSINLSSQPQVVLDGVRLVEFGILRQMPAATIERIELLVGPDATTRYGTNAGHGVIIITTRTTTPH